MVKLLKKGGMDEREGINKIAAIMDVAKIMLVYCSSTHAVSSIILSCVCYLA